MLASWGCVVLRTVARGVVVMGGPGSSVPFCVQTGCEHRARAFGGEPCRFVIGSCVEHVANAYERRWLVVAAWWIVLILSGVVRC